MKAVLKINCDACGRYLGETTVDTATMADELQQRINLIILRHRSECKYYGGGASDLAAIYRGLTFGVDNG